MQQCVKHHQFSMTFWVFISLYRTCVSEKPAVNHNLAVSGEIAREYQEELQKVSLQSNCFLSRSLSKIRSELFFKAREEFKQKRMEEAKANEEYILANVSESKRKKLKTLLELQQQQKHSDNISKPQVSNY